MRLFNFYLKTSLVLTALSINLTGCMVGPDFHTPTAPQTKTYTEKPLPTKTVNTPAAGVAGKAQSFVTSQDIPAQWWYLFHSPALNELVTVGLTNSPNLAAAEAALRQAQENLYAQIGSTLLPTVNAQLSGAREKTSNASLGTTTAPTIFNLYNASVAVSYTLDVFGGSRRQIEASAAQVDYQHFQLEAAHLTLTSNIVTTAITIASLQEQITATQELIRAQADQLAIVAKQLHLGGASESDVLTQQTQLAQTQATLPPLEQKFVQSRDALAVLVGAFPSESQLPAFNLEKLCLPTKLPVSLPSLLVQQRPDIRASEALLHAASAQVGVATANLFPNITLTGNYGWDSTIASNLFSPVNNVWNLGGQLLQPVFHGGALRAQRRAAIAGYDQALAQYQQTVLQAFQNVADTLRALDNDAKTLQAQQLAETSAHEALVITEKQYRLGGVSYLSLLNAQRQYQQTRISRIQAQAARFTDTAALFQALGGGWWNENNGKQSS